MAKKRSKDKHLPKRVYLRSGTYYFVDGAGKWNNLGREYSKAIAVHSQIVGGAGPVHTITDLIDRYMLEVSPMKAASTHESEIRRAKELRKRYGHMRPDQLTARAIYAVMDKRGRDGFEVSANRELALLSHMFKKAIRWGVTDSNPCIGIERFKEYPRERYITNTEYADFQKFAGPRIAAYMDFKLLTGLRQGDVLSLRRADLKDHGIEITVGKTSKTMIIGWTDHLRVAVNALLDLHPKRMPSLFLFCTRTGQPYTSGGFRAIWQRKMKKAVEQGVLKERFREHDLRAKTGSDTDLEHASELLAHLDRKTTQRHYRRLPNIVKPLK